MIKRRIISATLYMLLLGYYGHSQSSQNLVYVCDTTNEAFYNKIKSDVQKIARLDNDLFFNLYEGEQGYSSAYSFVYWVKKKKRHNKLFSVISYDDSGNIIYSKTSDIVDYELKIDTLLNIFEAISQVQADTNAITSHDHLFVAEIWYKKKKYIYKFCFSQLSTSVFNKEYLVMLLTKISK